MILRDIVNKYNKDKMLSRKDIIILIEKYNLIVQDLKNHENLCLSILYMIHELCDIKGIKNKYKDKENKILLDKHNGFTFIPNTDTIYLIKDVIELLEYTESLRETIDSFGYDNISDAIKIIYSYWDNKINYKKYIKEHRYYIVSDSLIKSHYYELLFKDNNLREQQTKYRELKEEY